LTEETLTNEVNRQVKQTTQLTTNRQAPLPEPPPVSRQYHNRNKTRLAFENAERYLIANLLKNNFTEKIQREIGINFNLDIHKVIVTHIYALLEEYETINVSQLYDKLNDEELIQTITDITLIPISEFISEAEINDYINMNHRQATGQHELDKLKNELVLADNMQDSNVGSIIADIITQLIRNKV